LIPAASDRLWGELRAGAFIPRPALGTSQFNIIAIAAGATLSVRFAFDGNASYRVENEPPFSLFGDRGGDYRAWNAGAGVYTLAATAFAATDARGEAGGSWAITFRVV
jgi:hypothetical protein